MWLFTVYGFYSVVRHKDDPSMIIVRARRKEDLERLRDRDLRGMPEITETPEADYPFRIFMHNDDFLPLVAEMAWDIDYENFKNEVHRRYSNDRRWHAVLTRIWAMAKDLGERASREGKKSAEF